MPNLNIKNLRNESNTWTHLLRSMSDENIVMKTRLSEMLQEDFDIALLPRVEHFHSLLLTEEEFINLLRHNIAELDHKLDSEQTYINPNEPGVDYMSSRLQQQMITADIRFRKLKSDFYKFLTRTEENSM